MFQLIADILSSPAKPPGRGVKRQSGGVDVQDGSRGATAEVPNKRKIRVKKDPTAPTPIKDLKNASVR